MGEVTQTNKMRETETEKHGLTGEKGGRVKEGYLQEHQRINRGMVKGSFRVLPRHP